jgi:hypothetical protein
MPASRAPRGGRRREEISYVRCPIGILIVMVTDYTQTPSILMEVVEAVDVEDVAWALELALRSSHPGRAVTVGQHVHAVPNFQATATLDSDEVQVAQEVPERR